MHSGESHPLRAAARSYNGTRRPIRIENIKQRRVSDGVELCFDMEFDDLWRYPRDEEPGNWNAAWLFVKFRQTRTTQNCTREDLIRRLAPSDHLPGDLGERLLAQARQNLEEAMRHLSVGRPGAAPGPALGAGDADAEDLAAMSFDALGSISYGVGGAAAAVVQEQDDSAPLPDDGQARFLTLPRTHLLRGDGGGSPGNMTAQTDRVTVVYRTLPDGQESFDFKELSAWDHARLSTRSADHSAPLGMTVKAVDDGMGVFVHRAAGNPGAGPQRLRGVTLRWNPSSELEFPLRVWIHAVEMIYVPEGAFELGDPQGVKGPMGCFFSSMPTLAEGGAPRFVWRVASEDEIPVCGVKEQPPAPHLTWDNRGQSGTWGSIPAPFPKGYHGFYCMRRQLTQGQYADFINSLRGHAKTARFPYGGQGDYRYTIYKTEGGMRAATRPNRACTWMSWADALGWLWWSGLRPMTELEYEKAARGRGPAVAGEYAWGNTGLEKANVISGDEAHEEVVTGNCHVDNTYQELLGGDGGMGPVRDDAFLFPGTAMAEARDGSGYAVFPRASEGEYAPSHLGDARTTTGSSYWGIMALSGNLWEFVVTAGSDRGRAYEGAHGDGKLGAMGVPDLKKGTTSDDFPMPHADARGIGFRGGSWFTGPDRSRIADRGFGAGLEGYTDRSHDTGARGVRTAPGYAPEE